MRTVGSGRGRKDHETSRRSAHGERMMPKAETLQALFADLGAYDARLALAQIGQRSRVELSYAELDAHAARLAGGLISRGLTIGDRVMLLAPNSPDWVVACIACLRAGAVPVPVDSQMPGPQLEHIAADCAARWLFTTSAGVERVDDLPGFADIEIITLDAATDSKRHWRGYCEESVAASATPDPDDVAVIFYTSGTSGLPKGVTLTHKNILSNIYALLSLNLVQSRDRVLLPLPLHHVYPFVIGLCTPLTLGMGLVVPSSLVGQHFFAALHEGSPSILLGVPRLYEALLATIEQKFDSKGRLVAGLFHALLTVSTGLLAALRINVGRVLFRPVRAAVGRRLRLLISGGSAMDAGVAMRLRALGFRLAAGYGLTETSPILSFRSADMPGDDHVGRALPGVELRIAKPQSQLAHGEVQARGPNVFSGYLGLPEKTAAAFTDDGWFRTGDLGELDENGYLRLYGRMTSMIVMPGGENIDPEKIEQRLEQLPAIREAAVVLAGGQLSCIIVPSAELMREEADAALLQLVRDAVTDGVRELASYQRPSKLLIDKRPLPRTRLGKLKRRDVAERFRALESAGSVEPSRVGLMPRAELAPMDRELLEDPLAASVWAWLGRRFADKPISPDTHMQIDLGVDSLGWLGLTLELRNEIGIDLTDDAVARIELVRDLLQEATSSARAEGLGSDVIELLRQPEALIAADDRQRWLTPRTRFHWVLDWVAAMLVRVLMRLLFRLRIDGIENVPIEGPVIISPNHVSALDPLAVAASLSVKQFHTTFWGGWVGILFKNPLSRAFSHAMRILPVEPKAGPISNLALASAVLGRARSLVWFPEGERSHSGELSRFRPGVGLLMLAADAPVVPVWIEGAGRALPPGRRIPRPTRIALRFGTPVRAAELDAEGRGDSPEERIANALERRVAALAGPAA